LDQILKVGVLASNPVFSFALPGFPIRKINFSWPDNIADHIVTTTFPDEFQNALFHSIPEPFHWISSPNTFKSFSKQFPDSNVVSFVAKYKVIRLVCA